MRLYLVSAPSGSFGMEEAQHTWVGDVPELRKAEVILRKDVVAYQRDILAGKA